jgi:hypothetical protein
MGQQNTTIFCIDFSLPLGIKEKGIRGVGGGSR